MSSSATNRDSNSCSPASGTLFGPDGRNQRHRPSKPTAPKGGVIARRSPALGRVHSRHRMMGDVGGFRTSGNHTAKTGRVGPGRNDSNLGMAEPKSDKFPLFFNANSEKWADFGLFSINRLRVVFGMPGALRRFGSLYPGAALGGPLADSRRGASPRVREVQA
jgi:hypothetical protein